MLLSASKAWFWVQREAVYEVPWHGPKVINCFTGIPKRVVRWWKRSFCFSKKIKVTFSSNWSMPYQGGCSHVLISSRRFDSSICDWKNKFSLGNVTSFAFESFRVDFRCVHRLRLLKVCNQYVTLPNSTRVQSYPRNNPDKTFFPIWWILDWPFAVTGWYSTNEQKGIIGPLNGCPNRLS